MLNSPPGILPKVFFAMFKTTFSFIDSFSGIWSAQAAWASAPPLALTSKAEGGHLAQQSSVVSLQVLECIVQDAPMLLDELEDTPAPCATELPFP